MTQSVDDWLAKDFSDLTRAVADAVGTHAARLRDRGMNFYGYAILPGEPGNIQSIVAVANCESDIEVQPDDSQYRYYRYSVDEWKHYFHDGFDSVNAVLHELNAQFERLHPPQPDCYEFDDYEIRYASTLLNAIVEGLKLAKSQKVFGPTSPFLAIWISDSDGAIIRESVKSLNDKKVAEDFMIEFGE